MPSITPIVTTAGRAEVLAAVAGTYSLTLDDVQLSDNDQAVSTSTTALTDIVATLPASGSVRSAGGGHALHIVIVDDSTAAYEVRAFSLRLSDGTYLMVYSQAGLIVTKAASSSLHLSIDLTIDADIAATIDFGDTDYLLPAASEDAAGILELATEAEVDAGVDSFRVVTPYHLARRVPELIDAHEFAGEINYATPKTRKYMIPLTSFLKPDSSVAGWKITTSPAAAWRCDTPASQRLNGGFQVPDGCIVTELRAVLGHGIASGQVEIQLFKYTPDFTTPGVPTLTTLGSATLSAAGYAVVTITPNAHTFDPALEEYRIIVVASASGSGTPDSLIGVEATITDPGPRNMAR